MRFLSLIAAPLSALTLIACDTTHKTAEAPKDDMAADTATLADIVAARSDKDKARDQWRNPAATLAFFEVTPESTVVEALPGRGWYTRVILPYIAENGRYIGVNYQDEMWPLILPDPTPELVESLSNWVDTFPAKTAAYASPTEPVTAYEFGDVPDELAGEADVVLMIRALHNFNRAGGGFGAEALADAYALLKPGGVLGVVQHHAPIGADGAAADGTLGYMSRENVIAIITGAGFELDGESNVNANPADQPGPGEFVWRLPPTYGLGEQGRDKFAAIGETNRMTLRFRKPAN